MEADAKSLCSCTFLPCELPLHASVSPIMRIRVTSVANFLITSWTISCFFRLLGSCVNALRS